VLALCAAATVLLCWESLKAVRHADVQVLTIRPGFEKAFLTFMENGSLDELDLGAEYISVADELKALATTNYAYTPSANEENPNNLVDTWYEFTPTGALDVNAGATLGDPPVQ
jgi:hypothetical protein